MAPVSPSASGLSIEQALSQPVEELLPDAAAQPSTSSPSPLNGADRNGDWSDDGEDAEITRHPGGREMLEELRRTRDERDGFEAQYKSLLAKLTQMRSTLGDRLRQDAEELDRRESQIETLSSQVQELQASTSTLKSELISSHTENERVTRELDALRQSSAKAIEEATMAATATATALQSSSSAASPDHEGERDRFEAQVSQLTQTVESLSLQLSQHETAYKDAASQRQEMEVAAEQAKLDKEFLEGEVSRWRGIAEREKESARSLQLVLEEFQKEQETELQWAIEDYKQRYVSTAALLEEYKERVAAAEKRYHDSKDSSERVKALEQDVKEKNLLIGKLRHEAVILNEHLTEALRRLNQDNSSLTVDRRLVTNVLLQFLVTPRQDAKRFEMLNLLASILQWSDEEKESAGIQRSGGTSARGFFGGGRSISSGSGVTAQDESFSNLFVEYLLSEADKAKTAPTSPTGAAMASSSSSSTQAGNGGGGGIQTAPATYSSFDINSLGSLPPSNGGSNSTSHGNSTGGSGVNLNNLASSRRSGSISGLGSPVQQKGTSAGVKSIPEEKES